MWLPSDSHRVVEWVVAVLVNLYNMFLNGVNEIDMLFQESEKCKFFPLGPDSETKAMS